MRLVILILLLAPLSAHAAPVVTAIGAFLATTIPYIGLTIGQALMIGTLVYGAAQQRKQKRKARDEYNASLQDRTVSRIATESPHVYVYGRAKVGSSIVAMFTSGDKDQYKHLVCVHAAHECDAIEEVYIAGKKLGPLDGNGYPTSGPFIKSTTLSRMEGRSGASFTLSHAPIGFVTIIKYYGGDNGSEQIIPVSVVGNTVTLDKDYGRVVCSYQYIQNQPNVRVRKHLGTPDDPADAALMAELPGKWTSNAVLRDFTYTVVTLNLNEPEFQGGPPAVEVLLRGKKLYDFRTGTRAWKQNNALAVYDYLTGELCGVDAGDLPMAQFIAAANVCDEAQSFGPRFTFNGTVTSDEDQKGVLERMAQSMAGGIVSTTWDIWAGKYVAPVMALEQSDIVGQIAITPGVSDADLYNGVRGQYISSETEYVATDFAPYQNPAYLDTDGRELWTNIDFPYTDSLQRVHNLCRIFTEDQRNGYTVKAEFSLKAWSLKVGQRITLTSPFFGWNAKIFRVTDKKYSPNSAVELTLKEDAAEIWDFADAVVVDATPNTGLPNPFDIDPLESIECESGTEALLQMQDGTVLSRILVTWPQATTQSVVTNGLIEIEWMRLSEDLEVWLTTSVKGDQTQAFLSDVEDGEFYVVRARTYNPYLNTRSDWVYAEHQVIGKTEPPSTVTGVAVTQSLVFFNSVDDLDLLGYEVRAVPGTVAQWSLGLPVHDGYITDSPYTFSTALQGVQTIMVAAIDTSGNYGIPGYATLDFGVIDEFNVAQRYDFEAAGFPGEITNATVVGGDLVADLDPNANFWAIGASSFWVRDNIADFWGGAVYLAVEYVARFVPEYTGGNIILDTAFAGSRSSIEWRIDGGSIGDFWNPPSADFWSGYPSIWGEIGGWLPYVGSIESKAWHAIQFRIVIDAGPQQGKITEMAIRLQMPDKEQVFTNISVSSSGTRLDPSLGIPPVDWIQVEEASFTIYADGSGAVAGRVTDFDSELGPEVELLNASGVAVNSTGQTVRLRGF